MYPGTFDLGPKDPIQKRSAEPAGPKRDSDLYKEPNPYANDDPSVEHLPILGARTFLTHANKASDSYLCPDNSGIQDDGPTSGMPKRATGRGLGRRTTKPKL